MMPENTFVCLNISESTSAMLLKELATIIVSNGNAAKRRLPFFECEKFAFLTHFNLSGNKRVINLPRKRQKEINMTFFYFSLKKCLRNCTSDVKKSQRAKYK